MLGVVLVLVGLVASAMAQCDDLARLKVKQQWAEAYGVGEERDEFGQAVWKRVYEIEPGMRDNFKDVRGDNIYAPQFIAHSARVLGGIDMCIALLDDADTLAAELKHLNGQHIKYSENVKIPDNYFDILRASVLEIAATRISTGFDWDAWEACLSPISAGIAGKEVKDLKAAENEVTA